MYDKTSVQQLIKHCASTVYSLFSYFPFHVPMFFLLLYACSTPESAPEPVQPTFSPSKSTQVIEIQLRRVIGIWEGGSTEEARKELLTMYETDVKPLLPTLSSYDPIGALEVEYAVGHLLEQMSGNDGRGVSQAADTLRKELKEEIGALPEPKTDSQKSTE